MLVNKYSYKKLERQSVDGRRHYCLPDGSAVPSVTTILDATKPQEARDALENWRNAVGHDRAQQITTEAANRGTRMHTYLERYVLNGEHGPRPSNPFAWPSHAMASTVIEKGLVNLTEAWGTEVPLYYSGLYAGTTDLVGSWLKRPAIVDFKQSNKPKTEERVTDYYLQLAAYAAAHNHMYNTNIQTGVVMMAVKPKEPDPPQFQQFVITGSEFAVWTDRWWDRVEQFYSS